MSSGGHASDDGSFARDVGTQTGKAIGLIVVAVVIAVVLLSRVNGTTKVKTSSPKATPAPTVTAPATTTTTAPLLPPGSVKVLVLNGLLTGSLAGNLSAQLQKNLGYNTLSPDNTTTKVTSSVIYAASAQYLPNAQALAQNLGLQTSVVATSVPPDAPISSREKAIAQIIVIIGSDLQSKAAKA